MSQHFRGIQKSSLPRTARRTTVHLFIVLTKSKHQYIATTNNMIHNEETTTAKNNNYTDKNKDTCTCTCFSPNGIVITILLNVLLWTALVFSGGALVDCHLVEADIGSDLNSWPALPSNLIGLTDGQGGDRRGFGFFIHEDQNGDCRWEYWGDQWDDSEDWTSQDEKEFEEYIEDYFEWMGSDWRRMARVGCAAAILGLALAVAATVYMCVSHVWILRYITGALAIVVVMPMQFAILGVMGSDFCKNRDCELQRSGGFAIVAGTLYLLAGAAFFFMKNYPGKAIDGASTSPTNTPEQHATQPWAVEEATHQDEEYTADYAVQHNRGDGIEEAREVKAQIY